MELTRRDALAALTVAGIGGAAAYGVSDRGGDDSDGSGVYPDDEETVETLVAIAEVAYPSEVEGIREFVETYVTGKVEADDEYAAAVTDALNRIDEYARSNADTPLRELAVDERDDLLREMGLENAASHPEGTGLAPVRYYTVNDLLYAMLTSPKGGEIMGIESPPGHPGGLEGYQGVDGR